MAIQQPNNNASVTQIVQISLLICLGLIGIYFFVSLIWKLLIWIMVAVAVFILFLNRHIVKWFYDKLMGLFQQNTFLGILGLIATVLVAPLVLLFLVGKTLYEYNDRNNKKAASSTTTENAVFTEVKDKPAPPVLTPKNNNINYDDETPIF